MRDSAASPVPSSQPQAMLSNVMLLNMAFALSWVDESIVWTDGDGRIQWCNAAFEQLVNQTAATLVDQRLTQLLPLTLKGQPLPLSQHPVSWGLANKQHCKGEYHFHRHDRSFALAITVAPLPAETDLPIDNGVMLLMWDITAPLLQPRSPQSISPEPDEAVHVSAAGMHKPNQWVTNILESITDAFYTLDENWCFTYLNHQAEQLLQRSRSDLLGNNVWEQFPEAVGSIFDREYHRAIEAQCSVAFEAFYTPLNAWFEVRVYPLANGLAVYFQDISERKRIESDRQQTEAALRESEQRFRSVFDTTAISMTVTSPEGVLLQVNAACCQMLGYTRTELLAKTCSQLIYPDDLESGQAQLQQLLSGELTAYNVERRYFHQQGHLVWGLLSVSAVRDEQQNALCVVYQIQDITDRKQAEAALRESETRLRLALKAAQMSNWDWDIQSDTAIYAGSLSADFEISSAIRNDAYASFLNDVHPDDRASVVQALELALQGAEYNIEFRAHWAGGTQHWVCSQGQVYVDQQGRPVRMLGVARSITKRKQAELALQTLNQELEERVQQRTAQLEESNQQLQAAIVAHEQTEAALRKSEERFRTIFDNAPIAISLADIHTYQIIEVNQAHHELLGYSNTDLGKLTHVDVTHPHDAGKTLDLIRQLLNGAIDRFQIEKRFVKKNGDWIWANLTVALIRDADGRAYSMGMIEDITDRKRAEEALRANQQLLQRVIDTVPTAIFWKDKNLHYLGCNHQFAIDAGLATPNDIIGKNDFELPWAVHAERCQVEDRQVITSDQPQLAIEETLVKAGEEQCWITRSKVPLHDKDGTVVGVLGTYDDITERRQVEKALRLTQFSVARVADPIWWVKPNGEIHYVNDAACCDLGYARDSIIGKRVSDFNPDLPITDWEDHWQGIKAKGSFVFETRVRAKNGTIFPVEVAANYIQLNNQEYHCSFVRNITDRKQAEDQLKASLKEKEVLLQEIHHRVKNNLQMVSSLLNLQANAIRDPKVLAPFRESQNRIKAMVLIHEKLYQSESLVKINFYDYVHNLATNLLHSYSSSPTKITLKLEIAQVELPVDTAIPCGLIINELVTNALKHAFPADRAGEIQICFSLLENNQYLLVIADNGVGIPESIVWSDTNDLSNLTSLGLQLVHAFLHQLRGTLEIKRTCGSSFELSFPNPV